MVVTPSPSATRAIESAASPLSSATRTASPTIPSTLRLGFGPRLDRLSEPHNNSRRRIALRSCPLPMPHHRPSDLTHPQPCIYYTEITVYVAHRKGGRDWFRGRWRLTDPRRF